MGPEVAALLGVGGAALVLVLALGLVWWGSSSRDPEVKALRDEVARIRLALDQCRHRASERAAGARADIERARDLATARARGDAAGVLQRFPDAPGAIAGEPGAEAGDSVDTGPISTGDANPLVATTGASGVNEIEPGPYTMAELAAAHDYVDSLERDGLWEMAD